MLKAVRLVNFKKLNLRSSSFLIFCLLAILMIIGELYFSYPDEFDNILGGHYILQGRLPYIGFFTHHNPLTYFFAAPISLLAGQSFVKFRLVLGIVYALMMVGFYIWIRRRFGVESGKIILTWLVFVAVGATYWWGQMLLADSLSSYLIAPPVILLFWLIWQKEKISRNDLWFISVLTALSVLTTFTLIYLACAIYLFTLIWVFRSSSAKLLSRENFKILGILALPYVIFALYLIVTGSLQEYLYQSVVFNTKYYALLPGGVSVRNPLRVAVVLFYQFFTNFKTMLVMTKDLNFGSPFAQTLVLSNATLLVYSIMERRFFLGLFIILTLIFSIIRSNPYTTAETDYQGMTYHLISIFNGLVVLSFLWKALNAKTLGAKYLIYAGSFLFLAVYFLFFGFHLSEKYLEKAYQKYMGTQSLIYDWPSIAPTLNKLLTKDDYYFLGPFDFENHLYINARLTSKYIVVIPAMDKSEKIQKELLTDLQNNKPKVIVFDTEMRVLGEKPGGFLKPFLDENYFNLEHLGSPCMDVKAVTKWFGTYDFERHFFFRRDDQIQALVELQNQKLVEPVDPNNIPAFCHDRFRENKPTQDRL